MSVYTYRERKIYIFETATNFYVEIRSTCVSFVHILYIYENFFYNIILNRNK